MIVRTEPCLLSAMKHTQATAPVHSLAMLLVHSLELQPGLPVSESFNISGLQSLDSVGKLLASPYLSMVLSQGSSGFVGC